MVPGSLRKCTNKQALACHHSQPVRHLLPRIRAALQRTPRRNLGAVLASIQMQRCLPPAPNLLLGRIHSITCRAMPTLVVPRNRCHPHEVPARGTKWIWTSPSKSRILTCPLTNTNIHLLPRLSRSNGVHRRLNKSPNNNQNPF